MTSLICISHGKSGTTFLDTVFRYRTNVAVSKGEKEIKYFNQPDVSLAGYAEKFGLAEADFYKEGFLSFEASPPYVTNQGKEHIRRVLNRIKDTVPDPRILIAVRNPAERAVSHYAHTLYEVSQRGYPPRYHGLDINHAGYPQNAELKRQIVENPFSLNFEEALQDQRLCYSSYADAYELALETFGDERISFFAMERDCADFTVFLDQLQRELAIEFDYDSSVLPVALPGRGVPYYLYGGLEGLAFELDGVQGRLLPRQLLIVRSDPALLLDDVSAEEYERLEAARASWTTSLSHDQVASAYDTFLRDDFERFLDLYRAHHREQSLLELYGNMAFREKRIKPARFEGELVNTYRERGVVGA
ncbi:sulfotransferase domain-containing protein [Kordiimonas gwangyangensis]|uniref:sulfotransferase domain-containing protein n=1 Tax=Kordiimonas gwangyangensis TaxID=288022 RepID=UPI00037E0F50|nr:sulfotransferase domain-containing protein [Kordiimonas gwangyangensis]